MAQPKVYLPVHALRDVDIASMLSVASPTGSNDVSRRFDHHHSRRTMIYFLLSLKPASDCGELPESIATLVSKLDWIGLEKSYATLRCLPEPYQTQNSAEGLGDYWETKLTRYPPGPRKSRDYVEKYRSKGFDLNELKLYWNYEEIRQLGQEQRFNTETDQDTHDALSASPVQERKNRGAVQYKNGGIETTVFDVPKDKQIIVLDFADERMPGGYFLENAMTQEEVILFNSDAYQALLDLKYKKMAGGYMLPEYGLAYVKNVTFVKKSTKEARLTDLIVAACYDLSSAGEGLYRLPRNANDDELRARTTEKLQAVVASAVANTNGNGANTYLLLGPIGTGAFGNDIRMIADLFSKILNQPLMNSTEPIRNAFDEVWFVSIDSLETFKKQFEKTQQEIEKPPAHAAPVLADENQ